jgi:hypothetical protein
VEYTDEEEENTPEEGFSHIRANTLPNQEVSTVDMPSLAALSLEDIRYVGFNGRFWVSASLEVVFS